MTAASKTHRLHRWSVGIMAMVLVSLLAPAGAAQAKAPTPPVPPNTGLTDKGIGVVSAADRDFVTKVRLAGLWEIPAGHMAQKMSDDPRVVAIGKEISTQHVALDALDRAAAAKLQISLPDEPNSDQQSWLAEMKNAKSSTEFDQIYIARLRAAHGKIFPAIANIRAGTRNDIVRKLAQQANQFVMTHMTLLESSGLVDYTSLPAVPAPVVTAGPAVDNSMLLAATGKGGVPGISTSLILLVLAAALIAGVVSTMRIFRTR
jgi:putative membrane protein